MTTMMHVPTWLFIVACAAFFSVGFAASKKL
jgi:hypothetical protein